MRDHELGRTDTQGTRLLQDETRNVWCGEPTHRRQVAHFQSGEETPGDSEAANDGTGGEPPILEEIGLELLEERGQRRGILGRWLG